MPQPLILRDADATGIAVVVRLGEHTLQDEHLARSLGECHERWGIWGFSVLEIPGGDYGELAGLRPYVVKRRQLLTARAGDLRAAGFPLLPTLDYPHWTVQLSESTVDQFERVRRQFIGPIDNPVWVRRPRRYP